MDFWDEKGAAGKGRERQLGASAILCLLSAHTIYKAHYGVVVALCEHLAVSDTPPALPHTIYKVHAA